MASETAAEDEVTQTEQPVAEPVLEEGAATTTMVEDLVTALDAPEGTATVTVVKYPNTTVAGSTAAPETVQVETTLVVVPSSLPSSSQAAGPDDR